MLLTRPPIRYVTVTPTVLNADAYDANDVIFDTTEIPGACSDIGIPTILDSIVILEGADQAAANMILHFFNGSGTFGTKDAAPSISDADAALSLGAYTMASASFLDYTNSRVASAHNLRMIMIPKAATSSIYVAGQTAGTPTYATGSLVLRFGFKDV